MENSPFVTLYHSCDYDHIDDPSDLAAYIDHFSEPANQHPSINFVTKNGKYLIILKDCSCLFPVSEDISGTDWTKIKTTVTPNVPSMDPALTAINTTLQSISKHGEERKNVEDMQKLHIDVEKLPDDVQKVYLQQQNKECFTNSNIKKFENVLTTDIKMVHFCNLLGKVKDQHEYF